MLHAIAWHHPALTIVALWAAAAALVWAFLYAAGARGRSIDRD